MHILRVVFVFNLQKKTNLRPCMGSLHIVVTKQNVKQKSSVHMSSLLEILLGFFEDMETLGKKN